MKPRIVIISISLILLYLHSFTCHAQNEDFHFEHLTTEDGLSNNSVWSIYQDSEGFMWFGTEEGLNKYDGYTFTTFHPDPHHPDQGLQHNIISDIHEDQKGRLWVATFGGGLHLVNKYTGKIKAYGIEPIRIDEWNVFTSIHEDSQGMLWIAAGKGLVCFNPETKEFIKYPNPSQSFTISVAEDHTGRFWIGTWNDLFQFDRDSGKFSRVLLDTNLTKQPQVWSLHVDKEGILWLGTREDGLYHMNTPASQSQFYRFNPDGLVKKNIHFNGIYEDNDGYLWLATTEGLQRIDNKTHEVITFRSDPQLPNRIGQNAINTTYQGQRGTLWVGTNTGIYKASPRNKKFNTYQLTPALPYLSESNNAITALHADTTGTLWLASTAPNFTKSFRNGLYQYDVEHREAERISVGSDDLYNLSSDEVWAIHQDQNGQLWIGTTEGLNLLDRKTKQFTYYPSKYPVHYIDEDPSGTLWVGGDSAIASFDQHFETYSYYTNTSNDSLSLNDHFLFDILASSSGDIYVATASGGINRLNPKTGKFTYYLPDQTSPEGHLNDKHIITLYEDSQGIIWVGTSQGGLNRFDPHTEKFMFFSTQEGLASNHVSSIISDKNENLWIGTSQGLSCFDPKTKVFNNYSKLDGLPSNGFVKGCVQNHKGRLLFGTANGFVIFDPDSIQDNATIPPVYITGLQVMDEERGVPAEAIELAHDENFLSFDFVAINYDAPEKNQYAYMLEGVDKDWVYSGTRRLASYTDLDPGEYTFLVKASNNDGIWNEKGTFLQVTILPPWWQTGWAYALYTILGLSLLYSLRQYTVNRERLKHELNIQRLESEKMHEIDRMKSRFFANISHEFRTPLTLILGPLDKLLTEADESKKELYQMMGRNAARLLNLINQLLDLAKLEAGSLELNLQPHALLPFLKGIVLSFSSLAERKNIKYSFQYPLENPVLFFDADKLEKVITNLLSNAFKFTPTGGEVLFSAFLKLEEGKAKNCLLEIQVKDSGMGVTEAQQSRIFNRFYQADATKEEGSGIGLSLVSELVDLYQGKISVESQPDKGSTFCVIIPLEKADYEEIQIHQHEESISKEVSEDTLPLQTTEDLEEAPHILLVEDNEDVRSFIKYILQDIYQVRWAGDGLEGLQKALEYIPDLILCDVMMPAMDGITLCEKLKQEEKTSHIPIIMLTAKASGGDKIEGLKTGADDYIIKPFQAEELLIRIENLIKSRQQLREQFSRQVSLEPMSLNINSTEERFIQKVKEVMEEHMTDFSFGVEAFGEKLNMSKMQLYRKLKALTDYTPSEFIRTMRMKRAAELLRKGAGNIGEIAYMVGYQDHAYFTRNFHKYYGKTPSEYITSNVKQ